MDKYLGKRLDGRYEVLELVGIGGMANVYRGYDVLEERMVAIKILRDEFLSNEEFVRRFKNESKAIAVLSHPNIVKVFDVSFSDRYQFIVMEYVDGITIKEYLSQQGVVGWKEVVHFTVEVLRALQHAHSKGIVHRDIKPHNIMLLSDGTIKVMDFGIARFARSETRGSTEKAIGSVHYISPEQARGESVGPPTDIYSVGVMMFELLTGQLPFEAETPVSVAMKQISAAPRRPRELNPDIPEGLEDIVIRAMQKSVDKRYQSAEEMLRDIDIFKHNPSVVFEYRYMTEPLHSQSYLGAIEAKTTHGSALAPRTKVRVRRENGKQQGGKNEMANRKKQGRPAIQQTRHPRYEAEFDEDNYEEEARRSTMVPVLIGVGAAFVLLAAFILVYLFVFNNPFKPTDNIKVPDYIGRSYDEVVKENPDLSIEVEERDYSTDYEEGVIYGQNPEAGKEMKQSATIKVKVSRGMKDKVVPDLVNKLPEDAKKELGKLGVKDTSITTEDVFDDTISEGTVVRTSPGKGEKLTETTPVVLYISKGPEEKEGVIPDVMGKDLEAAKAQLEAAGFKVGTADTIPNDKPAGTVVQQDPPKDTKVAKDTPISLKLSDGKGQKVTYQFTLNLPNYDHITDVQVTLDDKPIWEQTINPSSVGSLKGTYDIKEGSTLYLYFDNRVVRSYQFSVDASTGEVKPVLLVDNSYEFTSKSSTFSQNDYEDEEYY